MHRNVFSPTFPQTRFWPSTSMKTNIGVERADDTPGPSGGQRCYASGKNATWTTVCHDSLEAVPEHWLTAMMRVKIRGRIPLTVTFCNSYHPTLPSLAFRHSDLAHGTTSRSRASREHYIEEHTGALKPNLDHEPESDTERSLYREKSGCRYRGPCLYNTSKFP